MAKWTCAACHESDVPHHPRSIVCELCSDSAATRGLAWCSGRGLRSPHRVKADEMSGRTRKRPWCRACERAWQRQHQPHDEARAERLRTYRAEHAEQIAEARRAWDARNSDHMREVRRRWRARNIERVRAWARRWKRANPDKVRANNERDKPNKRLRDRRTYLRRKLATLRGAR